MLSCLKYPVTYPVVDVLFPFEIRGKDDSQELQFCNFNDVRVTDFDGNR